MNRQSDRITRKGLIYVGEAVTSFIYLDIDTGLIYKCIFISPVAGQSLCHVVTHTHTHTHSWNLLFKMDD